MQKDVYDQNKVKMGDALAIDPLSSLSFGLSRSGSLSEHFLRLNTAGMPMAWLSWQEAVLLHARDLVSWTYGDTLKVVRGGIDKRGMRTQLPLKSVLACKGKVVNETQASLSNATLFRRDHNTCLYCGLKFSNRDLSRDHVIPVSRGGLDDWMNVVTSCKRCNTRKGNRMLSESSLSLLALPYRPNHAEYLALTHSGRIRGDQMTFLKSQFSAQSRPQDLSILH